MAGYSGTPLVKKLGIKALNRLALLDAPEGFSETLGRLPELVKLRTDLRGPAPFDLILFFADSRTKLQERLGDLTSRITKTGSLWIAWPKKASGVATDLSESEVRDMGLSTGLVDNKICAVDETWSGLRFVRRVRDR